MSKILWTLASFTVISSQLLAMPIEEEQVWEMPVEEEVMVSGKAFSPFRVELGYAAGKFIGIDRNYWEFGTFLPFSSEYYTFLLDGKGYRFEDDRWGASIGIGVRVPISCSQLGLNTFYDYLEGSSRKSLDRIGFGLEWLGRFCDARANFYFPIRETGHSGEKVYHYQGGYIAKCNHTEYAIARGFDAEIGARLGCYRNLRLYGAAGPYYFSHKDFSKFWGGYARLTLDWNSLASLEVRASYDRVYDTQVQALIRFSIPLGCGYACCLEEPTRPIYRNGVIFTRGCCDYEWNW